MPAIPVTWWRLRSFFSNGYLVLFLFGVWAAVSVFWAGSARLAVFRLSLLAQALLVGGGVAFLLKKKVFSEQIFFWFVFILGVFEGLIGLWQVLSQEAVGLWWLGEPRINVVDGGIAKTVVFGGGRLLRAYGTFPHPNIFSAALLVSLLAGSFLFLKAKHFYQKIFFSSAFFIQITAWLLAFSRAGWLIGLLIIVFFCWRHWTEDNAKWLLLIIFFSLVIGVVIFWWAILPRLTITGEESSVRLRWLYNQIGWETVRRLPWQGAGIGNQVFYAREVGLFHFFGLDQPMFWQPIHNFYLLIAAELGLTGLAIFILFLFLLIRKLFKTRSGEIEIIGLIWLSLAWFGFFDHFFWTIPVGQILWWTPTLLILSTHSSTDRI